MECRFGERSHSWKYYKSRRNALASTSYRTISKPGRPPPEPQQSFRSQPKNKWLLETYFGTGSGYCIYTDRYVWSIGICADYNICIVLFYSITGYLECLIPFIHQ